MSFCNENKTWTLGCGNLRETNWNPFFATPVENYYATRSNEWNTASNVTPANHDLRHQYTSWKNKPTKENYYIMAKSVWGNQKPYTL